MEKMVGAGAEIFDKLEPESHKNEPAPQHWKKPNFFLPDQMITLVNVHTKYNFSSFSTYISQVN
jgi:hypothetical protein